MMLRRHKNNVSKQDNTPVEIPVKAPVKETVQETEQDYTQLSKNEIKEVLDGKGIEYSERDSKSKLLELLG